MALPNGPSLTAVGGMLAVPEVGKGTGAAQPHLNPG
jgi:hypothetical protein